MVNTNSPIGFFDSGVGGTSIWKEVITRLPNEDTIYLSDSQNAPYGEKSRDQIIALCKKNTEFLLQKNCKIIVVACNTATTNAIDFLRNNYNIPFIGIEPAIKPAAMNSKTKKIAILATKGTINSTLFEKTSSSINKDIQVQETIGKGLVELIEDGKLHSKEMTSLLTYYLKPMVTNNIDSLVLGCTHYPYLIPQIKKIIGDQIQVIVSGEAVARQTQVILNKHHIANTYNTPHHIIYTNKDTAILQNLLSKYIPKNLRILKAKF